MEKKIVSKRMAELKAITGIEATAPSGNSSDQGWGVERVVSWDFAKITYSWEEMEKSTDPFAKALINRKKELGQWKPAFTVQGLCTGICNGRKTDLGFNMEIVNGRVISFIARASMLPEMWQLQKEIA